MNQRLEFVTGFYPTWVVKQSTVDATNAWLEWCRKGFASSASQT